MLYRAKQLYGDDKLPQIRAKLSAVIWLVAISCLMFQCYYPVLSGFIIPSVIIYLVLNIDQVDFNCVKGWINLYIVYFFFLTISALVSSFRDNGLSNIIRFYLILIVIPIYAQLHLSDMKTEWKIFKLISVIKAATVFYIWLQVFLSQDYSEYRAWIKGLGTGDIYISNSQTKVQLVGNTLFVLGIIIDFFKEKKLTPFCIIMILAALASGNSAYILGIALVFGIYFVHSAFASSKRRSWKFIFIIIILLAAIVIFALFSINVLQLKANNANAVRFEQTKLLLDTNWLYGMGLGNSIKATTQYVLYNSNIYFELQTLYIFNQVGIIGLLSFYILTFAPLARKNNSEMVLAYIVFLAYSFWNPYCFDSNHIIALILIRNILYKKDVN